MVEKSSLHRTHRTGGLPLLLTHYTLRLLQLICSLATIIVWGSDLQSARNSGAKISSDLVFSVIVSSLSLIVTVVWMVPQVVEWRYFFVDAGLMGGWLVVFGIWGRNYIPRTCGGHECQELKVAVWLALAAWLMWIVTTVVGFVLFNRDRKNTHSGSWGSTIRGGRVSKGYPHSNV